MRSWPSAASRSRRARAMRRSAAFDRRLRAQDVDARRLPGLEEVARLPEPVPGERERLLLDLHERVAAHDLDVVRGRAQQDAVLGAADALLGRAHALLRLLVGALLPQPGEDRLLHGEAQVPVVERQDDALEVAAPERDLLAVPDEAARRADAGEDVREVGPPLGVGGAHLGPRAPDARVRVEGPAQGLVEGEGRAGRGERRLGARGRGRGQRGGDESRRRARGVSRSPPGAEPVQKQVHDPLHVLLRGPPGLLEAALQDGARPLGEEERDPGRVERPSSRPAAAAAARYSVSISR